MLRPLTEAARKVAPLGVGYWRTQRIRQRAQPPPRARTARSGECDPGQAGQGNMAASRLPSPNACGLSEPVVSAAGAGGERVFSGEAQAVGTSTGSEP